MTVLKRTRDPLSRSWFVMSTSAMAAFSCGGYAQPPRAWPSPACARPGRRQSRRAGPCRARSRRPAGGPRAPPGCLSARA
eukprot:2680676-Pleurochrysis_carterae.AAC.1